MPLYTINTYDKLEIVTKHKIAEDVTKIHCSITGAPKEFVHVVFADKLELKDRLKGYILASVRAGRTEEINQQLKNGILNSLTESLRCSASEITIHLLEVEASSSIEFGEILPEPGEEESWFQKLRQENKIR